MSHVIARLLGYPEGLRYLSLCSGIEAATTAWHSLGWTPLAFSEIEAFPSAVLKHHWPHVPNLGDMTRWREWPEELLTQVDVLVGGTPCQAFSVAGLRNSLDDERGNLTLVYAHIIDHIDTLRRGRGLPPVICVWENVPGVLSTKDNAFGCFLGALAGESDALIPAGVKWTNAGYVLGPERAIAWRTIDAQYLGVAQRRRRVFLVASARNGFCPGSVLFESEGVRRDSPPSREKGQGTSGGTGVRAAVSSGQGWWADSDVGATVRAQDSANKADTLVPCWWDGGQVSQTLDAVLSKGQTMPEKNRFPAVLVGFANQGHFGCMKETDVGDPLRSKGGDTGHGGETVVMGINEGAHGVTLTSTGATLSGGGGKPGQGYPAVLGFYHTNRQPEAGNYEEVSPTIKVGGGGIPPAVAFAQNQLGEVRTGEVAGTLNTNSNASGRNTPMACQAFQVRRLTPIECARLQGFPDGHTDIKLKGKPTPDGPQYKAYGNSMAVPCMKWIGERIQKHLNA